MYARLLVRSVVSLALYSGRCLDVGGDLLEWGRKFSDFGGT